MHALRKRRASANPFTDYLSKKYGAGVLCSCGWPGAAVSLWDGGPSKSDTNIYLEQLLFRLRLRKARAILVQEHIYLVA